MMKTVPFGSTGVHISPLCFGSLPFSPLQGYTGGTERAGAVLTRAFELGVNFIDTAQLYGNYAALRSKHSFVYASKTYAHTREGAAAAVEEARRGLDRDVIDLFLLHEQESEHTLRGHAPALEELYRLKAKGVLRAVGLSSHHVSGVWAAVRAGLDAVHPLLNMAGLGIADGSREEMEQAVAAASDAGLGVYVMKALGGGHLFRRAQEALTYASRFGHSLALGMRDIAEVEAAAAFFQTGGLPVLKEPAPRSLHIAEWCGGCGRCAAACPSDALAVINGKARPQTGCVLCGYCGAACPEFCIKVV
ncbi:MAG: aldo/keto reductase [Oscillospiraceae bacterium]|nr:aldo/keto reductase [Oscillospiraceae bacterium]